MRNKELWFVLLGAFVLQLLVGTVIIYQTYIAHVRHDLEKRIENIKTDIKYENAKWNLDAYNKDPDLLGIYPLYIITTDGYVLDRRDPIHGFLDISDSKRLLSFDQPRTFTSITNQTWRIYVKRIFSDNNQIGVIAVSYYNPPEEIIGKIDKQLVNNADFIYSKLKIKNGTIDRSDLNIKQLDYDIAFIIIDSFNTIILKTANVDNTNRIPNVIDPSYVKSQLSHPDEKIIKDSQTGELFLTIQTSIESKRGLPQGIIITGQSITSLIEVIKQYVLLEGISSVVVLLSALYIIGLLIKSKRIQILPLNQLPQKVVFSQKKGMLTIDGTDILVPYATNQFYLLQALFSNPTKRWETDELLERFGENKGDINNRKVYDAMISINKKVSEIVQFKLVLNQSKTYQLNPIILASK